MNDQIQEKDYVVMGLGIASLVFGIAALPFAFIPCCGTLAIIPAGLGLLFGAIGFFLAKSRNRSGGLCTAALVVSLIAAGIAVFQMIALGGASASTVARARSRTSQFGNQAAKGAPAEARGPVMGLSMMKPFMGMMVAPTDKPAVDKMFADLDAKASRLDAQDGKDLKAAMDAYNESNRSAGADQLARQAGARKLIADAQAVLDRH